MSKVRLPNLFLIGGMRCGSTSLHLMLGQHPDIFMSPNKEPGFFIAEAMRLAAGSNRDHAMLAEAYAASGKHRTPETYRQLFAGAKRQAYVGESSMYLYHPQTIGPIRMTCPEPSIVVSLRDPTERLYSEYLLWVRTTGASVQFEEFALAGADVDRGGRITGFSDKSKCRLSKGMQSERLTPWIAAFGRQSVYFALFDDVQTRLGELAAEIYGWLGVDSTFRPAVIRAQRGGVPTPSMVLKLMDAKKGHHFRSVARLVPRIYRERIRAAVYSKTLERPPMGREIEARLREFYDPDVRALQDLLARDLSAWRGTVATAKAFPDQSAS